MPSVVGEVYRISSSGAKNLDKLVEKLRELTTQVYGEAAYSNYFHQVYKLLEYEIITVREMDDLLDSLLQFSFNLTKIQSFSKYMDEIEATYQSQYRKDQLLRKLKSQLEFKLPLNNGFGMKNQVYVTALNIIDDSYDESDLDIVVEKLMEVLGQFELDDVIDGDLTEMLYDLSYHPDFDLVNQLIQDLKNYQCK